jgi:DNA-binding cell septation regulator SpoVG
MTIVLSDIRFTTASRRDRDEGLLVFAMCRLDGRWQLDGLRVCKTADGRYVLVFPSRMDGDGVERTTFRSLDQDTRQAIEAQVIDELRQRRCVS